MDRFIGFISTSMFTHTLNLKSNMDRFIVVRYNEQKKHQPHLKSNMDRFIGTISL